MPVRSNQLALASVAGDNASHTIYTVPAGMRTIVRSIVLQNIGTAGATTVGISTLASGTYRRYRTSVLNLDERVVDEVWRVLLAGQSIAVFSSAKELVAHISGAELAL